MATIKQRKDKQGNDRFYVRIRRKGHPLISGVFPNKSKAKEFIRCTDAAIDEGRYIKDAEAKKHTFGELADRYIEKILPKKPASMRKQKAQLGWWKQHLGHYLLSNVTPPVIVELRENLETEKLPTGQFRSGATVNRYLAVLSHTFTVAVKEWGWMDDTPMRKVSKLKESLGRNRFLNADERECLLEACKKSPYPYLYLVVMLALSTGMRYSEIMNLTWKNVDFERETILLEKTKNGDRGLVPLVGPVHGLLLAHSKNRRLDSYLLFPSARNPGKPASIRSGWEKALELCKIDGFHFHDLRHSFGTEMARMHATQPVLRLSMRHKSSSMTAKYCHAPDSAVTETVRRMTDDIFPLQSQIPTAQD